MAFRKKKKNNTTPVKVVSGTFLDEFFDMSDEDQDKFVANLLESFRPQILPDKDTKSK